MHVKYMSGGFQDETWPSDSKHDYVCTLAKCYESDSDSYSYHDECCYGHYESDQLMDWTTGNTNMGYGPTNKAMLKNTNPSSSKSYSVNYIYDNFDFSHCDDAGKSLCPASSLIIIVLILLLLLLLLLLLPLFLSSLCPPFAHPLFIHSFTSSN